MIHHRACAVAGEYGEDDAQRIVVAQVELHCKGGGGDEKEQRHEKSRGEKTLAVLHDVTAGDVQVYFICIRRQIV